jgi:hypothetical protein
MVGEWWTPHQVMIFVNLNGSNYTTIAFNHEMIIMKNPISRSIVVSYFESQANFHQQCREIVKKKLKKFEMITSKANV